MGRSESAYAFVGYSVSIEDLLENIHDEESLTYAHDTLMDSDVFLADENEEVNCEYVNRVEEITIDEEDTWESNKERLEHTMMSLQHETLLIPVIELASNTRWGYNREGIHGGYTIVSDDFNERLNQLYRDCPIDHKVVWMVRQSGG